MKKKSDVKVILLLNFKSYYKVVIWRQSSTHKDRYNEKTMCPNIKHYICNQLIFDKGVMVIHWGKSLCLTNDDGQLDITWDMNLKPHLTSCTDINLNWIIDLIITAK